MLRHAAFFGLLDFCHGVHSYSHEQYHEALLAVGFLVCTCCSEIRVVSQFSRRQRAPYRAVCKDCMGVWGAGAVRIKCLVRECWTKWIVPVRYIRCCDIWTGFQLPAHHWSDEQLKWTSENGSFLDLNPVDRAYVEAWLDALETAEEFDSDSLDCYEAQAGDVNCDY